MVCDDTRQRSKIVALNFSHFDMENDNDTRNTHNSHME